MLKVAKGQLKAKCSIERQYVGQEGKYVKKYKIKISEVTAAVSWFNVSYKYKVVFFYCFDPFMDHLT